MKCERIRETIMLESTGEVTSAQRRMVAEHLAGCASCQEFDAIEVPLPFASVRSQPPLTGADYAGIRAAVMSATAGKQRRISPFMWRFAFGALAVVLVAIAALVIRPRSRDQQATASPRSQKAISTVAQAPTADATPRTEVTPATVNDKGTELIRQALPPQRNHRTRERPVMIAETRLDAATQLRMEFQTADPEIRIIWLTNTQADSAR